MLPGPDDNLAIPRFSTAPPDGGMPAGWGPYVLRRDKRPTLYEAVNSDRGTVLRARAERAPREDRAERAPREPRERRERSERSDKPAAAAQQPRQDKPRREREPRNDRHPQRDVSDAPDHRGFTDQNMPAFLTRSVKA